MINTKQYGFRLWTLVFGLWLLIFLQSEVFAQSTNQSFPTPVTSNEINGKIKARDLGDARLTSYFYAFNGNQGDIFINVVTKNLDGDIDVFTADNLKPLTKITVYSDNPESETGRVIYLRQPQKLILRIEGKSPTDDPATFKIKFAGSFEAMTGTTAENDESKQPEVITEDKGEVRVNSVGTIIETKPKPTPKPKTTTAKVEKEETKKEEETSAKVEKDDSENLPKKEETEEKKSEKTKKDKKFEVVVTDNLPVKKDEPETKTDETVAEKDTKKNTAKKQVKPPKTTPTPKIKPKTTTKKTDTVVDLSQLENIRLVVIFKDGTKIERPMSEVLKINVDKGILTVIAKDGTIGRYSILDVAKMTIE